MQGDLHSRFPTRTAPPVGLATGARGFGNAATACKALLDNGPPSKSSRRWRRLLSRYLDLLRLAHH
jgi:hypothetical protein